MQQRDSSWSNPVAVGLLSRIGAFSPSFKKRVRDLCGMPESLARIGSLELRLAVTRKEIRRAQKLRWRVFFKEGGARADTLSQLRRRDICAFDEVCDHLIVIDHEARTRTGRLKPRVVGVYRLLRQDVAERNFGFYSATEFDIAPMLAAHPGKRFLELGRSCVLPDYRSKRTLELLWRGIWAYAQHHRMDAMIGCASLQGVDATAVAEQLAFLHHFACANDEWRASALPHRYCNMALRPREGIDRKRALLSLPPLVKGYLRLGAMFGDGAVIDTQFGTTDVFVVLPIERIQPRYIEHFTSPASEANTLAA